jgi:hypothetical protein
MRPEVFPNNNCNHNTSSSAADAYQDLYTQHQQQQQQQQLQSSSFKMHGSWVDTAVLSIAMACNLCDMYTDQQIQYEWKIERQDTPLSSEDMESFDEFLAVEGGQKNNHQVQAMRQFLFDESSVSMRLEDDNDEDNQEEDKIAVGQQQPRDLLMEPLVMGSA